MLLELGADIGCTSLGGSTVLHGAAAGGSTGTIALLLKLVPEVDPQVGYISHRNVYSILFFYDRRSVVSFCQMGFRFHPAPIDLYLETWLPNPAGQRRVDPACACCR